MKRLKRLLAIVYDIPNALRVLEIMDAAGCDIEQVRGDCWRINPKWYVTREEAEDLREIILHKQQIKKRSWFWSGLVFPEYRRSCRVLPVWISLDRVP